MRRYLTPDRAGDLGIRNGIGQGGSPWGPGHVSPIWLLPLWAPKLSSSLGSAKPGSVMSLSQFHSVARERNGDWTGLNAESPLCSAYFSAAESKPFVNRWHVRLLLIFHSHHHLMPWPSHSGFPRLIWTLSPVIVASRRRYVSPFRRSQVETRLRSKKYM